MEIAIHITSAILLRTVLLGNPGIAITAGTSRVRLVNKAA
jgi:hypothetical protein